MTSLDQTYGGFFGLAVFNKETKITYYFVTAAELSLENMEILDDQTSYKFLITNY